MVRRCRPSHGLLLHALLIAGCTGLDRKAEPAPVEDNPALDRIARDARSSAYRGTVGEATLVQGVQKMSVRGYGLVVGLGRNGSRSCPAHIRQRVVADIRRTYKLGDSRVGLGDVSAEALVDDIDTAVVRVEGEIGAAALRGSTFDLFLEALPGTETTSLEGGHLYSCDLHLYRAIDAATVQEGKVLARGEGRIFMRTPRSDDDEFNPRIGRIVAGGTSLEDRRVFLRPLSASYAMAVRVQDRVNSRFGHGERLAIAESPGRIALTIPPREAGRELDFLERVRHLYLSDEVGFADGRVAVLLEELRTPDAPHDSIALALEGIGKTVRTPLRNLYEDPEPHVRYHAARTGIRLEDRMAVPVLQALAEVSGGPFQLEAIATLGEATQVPIAARAVRDLIDPAYSDITRIAAYEALIDNRIELPGTQMLGNHFALDLIPGDRPGSGLIYAKTADQCRIAIMGAVPCRIPMFYKHTGDVVTVSANAGANRITALLTTASGREAPPAYCAPDAGALVVLLGSDASQSRRGRVTGLGMSYATIVDVLGALCADGSLAARMVTEQASAPTLPDAVRREGRPESDL